MTPRGAPGKQPCIEPGTLIDGRYRVASRLAHGATSEVSLGFDEHLDRPVAVKVLRGETRDRRRFAAEARLLATLDHPNLVHLYDAIDADDLAVLVMELVDGPSLAQVLQAGALPTARAGRLGAEVATCLAYLHQRGVVHRDVKPANILLGSDGAARLADFGIARLVDATRLTVTGQSIGTPTYMSPEQLTGAPVGPPTDVYSLGLVLLEARTGRRAFPGQGHEAVAARLARGPDIPTGELGRGWAGLVAAMTATDPGRRPTAATVASVLGRGHLDDTAPTTVVAATPPGGRAGGRRSAVAVALLALALFAGLVASRLDAAAPPRRAPATTAPPATASPSTAPPTVATTASPPAEVPAPRPAHEHHGHGHGHG